MYGLRSIDWDDPNLDISFEPEPVLDAVAPGQLPGSSSSGNLPASSGSDLMSVLRQNKTVVFGVAGAVLLLAIMRR